MTAVAPLATDMYVPGLPQIAGEFAAPDAAVQLSLTGFLVGLAVGQAVLGPVSDALGRRPVLLAGALTFTVLSLCAAVAPGIAVLDAVRLLQGWRERRAWWSPGPSSPTASRASPPPAGSPHSP